jgi:hypothetical protein
VRVTSRPAAAHSEATSPHDVLGCDHPLTRALERHGVLRRQLGAVALVAVASAFGQLEEARIASLTIAAISASAALAILLCVVVNDERRLATECIIEGGDALLLAPVMWQRERLLAPAYREHLARSIERVAAQAEDRRWSLRGSRPLFRWVVVAAVRPELRGLAEALRGPGCTAVAVARAKLLLCDSRSPLYGEDPRLLREELVRIQTPFDT